MGINLLLIRGFLGSGPANSLQLSDCNALDLLKIFQTAKHGENVFSVRHEFSYCFYLNN